MIFVELIYRVHGCFVLFIDVRGNANSMEMLEIKHYCRTFINANSITVKFVNCKKN